MLNDDSLIENSNPRNTKKSSSDSLFNIVSNVNYINNNNNKIIIDEKNKNNFKSSLNEIEIYKNLISSSDYQINKLKNLIEIQNQKINSLKINNNLSFFQDNNNNNNNNENNIIIKNEIEKYKKKINDLKEDYNFLYTNLNNEKEYFKKKLNKQKENTIKISEHNKKKKEIENNNDKQSIIILEKLISLKNKLNECSKFINNNISSTISPILTKESNYLTTSNLLESQNKKIQEITIISYNKSKFRMKK